MPNWIGTLILVIVAGVISTVVGGLIVHFIVGRESGEKFSLGGAIILFFKKLENFLLSNIYSFTILFALILILFPDKIFKPIEVAIENTSNPIKFGIIATVIGLLAYQKYREASSAKHKASEVKTEEHQIEKFQTKKRRTRKREAKRKINPPAPQRKEWWFPWGN